MVKATTKKKTTPAKRTTSTPVTKTVSNKKSTQPTLHGMISRVSFNGSFIRTFLFTLLIAPLLFVATTADVPGGFSLTTALLITITLVCSFAVFELAYLIMAKVHRLAHREDALLLLPAEGAAVALLYASFFIVPNLSGRITNLWILSGLFLVIVLAVRFILNVANSKR